MDIKNLRGKHHQQFFTKRVNYDFNIELNIPTCKTCKKPIESDEAVVLYGGNNLDFSNQQIIS